MTTTTLTNSIPADDLPTGALVRFAWRAGFAPSRLLQMQRDGVLKVVRLDDGPVATAGRGRSVLGLSDRTVH